MSKIYGYCRVSNSKKNAKQDYERQRYLFENCGIKFDEIFEERISGSIKGTQRTQFNKMLNKLEKNDMVCFTETGSFGRNYIDCFEMIDIITQQIGASIKFLSNGIELKGGEKMNPYEWLTISNFFIMDEFLKRQISYNTKNALEKKKVDGLVLGRPRTIAEDTRNMVISMHQQGKYGRDIAKELGISCGSVSRILKEYREE